MPRILIALVLLAPDAGQAESDLRDLVRRLGSEHVEERERARKLLKEAGRTALPVLESAARDKDPEVAARALELLQVLKITEQLSPALRRELRGVEDRLASGGPDQWTRVFLDAVAIDPDSGQWLHPTLKRIDLEVLIAPALRGADPGSFIEVCEALYSRPSVLAIPELVQRLEEPVVGEHAVKTLSRIASPSVIDALLPRLEKASPDTRRKIAQVLADLRLPEAAAPLARLLEDPSPEVMAQAIRGLGGLRHRPAGPALVRCLKGAANDTMLEGTVLEALGRMGYKEAAPDMIPYLDHPDPIVHGYAAQALGELGWKEAEPKIRTLLTANTTPVIWRMIHALARLEAKGAIPEIRKHVQGDNDIVRTYAIDSLARLGDVDSIGTMVTLIDDRDYGVSTSSRHFLRRWSSREIVGKIVASLKDKPQPDGFLGGGIETLADLGAHEAIPAILRFLKGEEPYVQREAAKALCRLGSDQGVDVLLEHPEREPHLICLNALRSPDLFRRLEESLAEVPEGRPLDLANAIARPLGCKVVFPEELQWPLNDYYEVDWFESRPRALDLLSWVADCTNCDVVLDGHEIRLLSRQDAAVFWRAWQSDRKKRGK